MDILDARVNIKEGIENALSAYPKLRFLVGTPNCSARTPTPSLVGRPSPQFCRPGILCPPSSKPTFHNLLERSPSLMK